MLYKSKFDSSKRNLYVQKVLKTMIESDERFRLIATFTDAFEAEKLCAYGKTDLVLMDVQTQNNHSGLAAGKRIKEASPCTKVVRGKQREFRVDREEHFLTFARRLLT